MWPEADESVDLSVHPGCCHHDISTITGLSFTRYFALMHSGTRMSAKMLGLEVTVWSFPLNTAIFSNIRLCNRL